MVSLTGCRTTTGVAPVTVDVRDHQTQQPVANVLVQAETVHFYVPVYPYPILDFNPPCDARAATGADGTVQLDLPLECPVRINIIAAGYEPLEAFFTDWPIWLETGQWIDVEPELGQTCGRRLEVRFGN